MMCCRRLPIGGGSKDGVSQSIGILLVLLLLTVVTTSNAFSSTSAMVGSMSSSFTQQSRWCQQSQSIRSSNGVQLSMMFDQLSAALTDVTKNFGKKR